MDLSSAMIMAPFNSHECKSKLGILFHNKGLYIVSVALENDPNATVEKAKRHTRLDESYGFIFISICLYLLFHIYGLTTPNQLWTKLESLFGVQDEITMH